MLTRGFSKPRVLFCSSADSNWLSCVDATRGRRRSLAPSILLRSRPIPPSSWKEAKALLDEAVQLLPEEPMIVSLQGLFYVLAGKVEQALESVTQACASPKSFGHAHHTYYQVACILAVLGRPAVAFEWLERSVSTGFACWPFFMKDPCLQNLRGLSEFEVLVGSLQTKSGPSGIALAWRLVADCWRVTGKS